MFEQKLLERKDNYHVRRYIKFIKYLLTKERDEDLTEHHILPKAKSCWPEYKNFKKYKWNKVLVTNREHFLCHYMLFKAFPENSSIVYSANMMKSFYRSGVTSKMFDVLSKRTSEIISLTNLGRKRTKEQKDNLSKTMKDIMIVFHKDNPNENFRIQKSLYDPEIHRFHRTGYKHTEETKSKIGKPGKIWVNNGNENKMVYPDEVPNNFNTGLIYSYDKTYLKDLIWAYNTETKEEKRLYKEELIFPWVSGRQSLTENNPGFETIKSMFSIVNLLERKATKVFDLDKSFHGPESGTSTEKTKVYVFDNYIFTNLKDLRIYGEETKKLFIGPKFNENEMIPKPHHNCKRVVNEFRNINKGLTYKQMCVKIFKLEEFNLEEHKKETIYWKI